MEASGANNKPKPRQAAIILHCAGPQVLEVYDHFPFEADHDKNDPAKVLEELEEYCNPRVNEVLQSFRFWNIPFHEPFDVHCIPNRVIFSSRLVEFHGERAND